MRDKEKRAVKFSREGQPETAVIYGRTGTGLRFGAQSPPEPDALNQLISANQVGRSVRLRYNDRHGLNIAEMV